MISCDLSELETLGGDVPGGACAAEDRGRGSAGTLGVF